VRNNLTGQRLNSFFDEIRRVCGGLNEKKAFARSERARAAKNARRLAVLFTSVHYTEPQTWPMTFAKIETNRR
jgi:hypothetical protein